MEKLTKLFNQINILNHKLKTETDEKKRYKLKNKLGQLRLKYLELERKLSWNNYLAQ